MKSIYRGGVVAVVLLSFAGAADAQRGPAVILNSLDVMQLVASTEPADQVRLAAHFSALTDQDTIEATRHQSMARSFAGTSRPQLDASMTMHCRQLTALALESAGTLRALAAYQAQLGLRITLPAPAKGARFYAGEGATPPSATDVRTWVARAKTSTEHRVLADYFTAVANRHAATEVTHRLMANTHRGTKIEASAAHCDRLVKLSRDGAREARVAAALHNQMAEASR
jgi:hypothetical protein